MELLLGGVVVSLIVQWVKNKYSTNNFLTMVALVSISLIGGAVYKILTQFDLWESFWNVIVYASAFYAVIIKNFQALPSTTIEE